MPEDHPGAVALFAEWLYSSTVRKDNTKSRFLDLFELYILANKLMIVELMDVAVDAIRDVSYDFNQFIELDLVVRIYAATPAGCLFRKFGVDLYLCGIAYEKYSKWVIGRGDEPDKHTYEIELLREGDVCFAHQLSREEQFRIWGATKDNSELFQDIFDTLQTTNKDFIFHSGWRSSWADDDSEPCEDDFHTHRQNGDTHCPLREPQDYTPHQYWIDDTLPEA